MEKLVNWNKYDNYRFPTIDEFTDNFEFEYAWIKTEPTISPDCKSTTVYWTKTKGFEDLKIERIKQMLETGYIRVVCDDTKVYVKVNESNGSLRTNYKYPLYLTWPYWQYKLDKQKGYNYSYEVINQKISKMKLYYFYVRGVDIVDNLYGIKGTFVDNKRYQTGVHKERPISKVIIPDNGFYNSEQVELFFNNLLVHDDLSNGDKNKWVQRLNKVFTLNGGLYRMDSNVLEYTIEKDKFYSNPFSHLVSKDELYICTEYNDPIIETVGKEEIKHKRIVKDTVLEKNIWTELLNSGIVDKDLPDNIIDSNLYKLQHNKEIMTEKKLRVPVKDILGNELYIDGGDKEYPVTIEVKSKKELKKRNFYLKRENRRQEKRFLLEEKLHSTHPTRKGKHEIYGKVVNDEIPGWRGYYWEEITVGESIVKIKVKNPKKVYIYSPKPEWKPLIKKDTVQLDPSPNRLVCIVSTDGSDLKRIPWIEAEELVKSKKYSYISKKVYKKAMKPKIGKAFTPALNDNGIYIDRPKAPRTISSTKHPIHKNRNNGKFKNIRDLKYYEVTFDKYISDGTGTSQRVYKLYAPNPIKAINRATKELERLEKDLDLNYFKATTKEIVITNTPIPEKPKNSILKPIIIKFSTPFITKSGDKIEEFTKWIRQYNPLKRKENGKSKIWKHPIKDIRK